MEGNNYCWYVWVPVVGNTVENTTEMSGSLLFEK